MDDSILANLSTTDWLGFFAFPLIIAYVAWTTSAFYRPNVIPVNTERVLIVGASSGVGRAIALKYAKRGAQVAVMGRRKQLLDKVRQECQAAGSGKALAVVGDFSEVDAVLNARKLAEKGKPDDRMVKALRGSSSWLRVRWSGHSCGGRRCHGREGSSHWRSQHSPRSQWLLCSWETHKGQYSKGQRRGHRCHHYKLFRSTEYSCHFCKSTCLSSPPLLLFSSITLLTKSQRSNRFHFWRRHRVARQFF